MSDEQFPVVGIGASAGGLEALREFVNAIPTDSGMAYVIVQHLAPDHPSIMDQLLAHDARVPVARIEGGELLKPDIVYVIPSGHELTVLNGRFRLHDVGRERGVRMVIDRFFISLAEEYGHRAHCIVLSGTGTDGTTGLRAIKAAGGVAMAQESKSAKFSGMPDNAAATGLVDFVLKPHRMPLRLQEIEQHRGTVRAESAGKSLQDEVINKLDQILALLAEEGHDFTTYKPGTLVRRIERRMTILRQRTVDGFIDRLTDDKEERDRLLQDFLIGVTRFFRDEDSFESLAKSVIAPLVKTRQRLRIWVPGCATGEEAYSIAILLAEQLEAARVSIPVQIFGTDIDISALNHARSGLYSAQALEGLDAALVDKYFVSEGDKKLIVPRLREMCVFAPHNLIDDPPFSRLDLISCRNVLIYLNTSAQRAVIPRFHFALSKGGYLFLGPSESLGQNERLFETLHKDYRIFVRDDAHQGDYSSLAHWEERTKRRKTNPRPQTQVPVHPISPEAVGDSNFESQIEQQILRTHTPPHVVVSRRGEIVYLSENMAPYVGPTRGTPSAALDVFLVRELRLPARKAIEASQEQAARVIEDNIVVSVGNEQQVVDVVAEPVPLEDHLTLVTIKPVRVQDAAELASVTGARSDEDREFLDRELALTRRQLSRAVAEHDAVDQELRSSNEELLSMNEELQSANEELETSREELQSINEELETVNAELRENNRQLVNTNSDLKNLFESAEIATLFLDSNLCVRRFTPSASAIFGLRDRDLGRPLEDMASKVPFEFIRDDAATVMTSLRPTRREVTIDNDRATFEMATRPYRTIEDRLDGSVVTFFDVSERKRSEIILANNERRYRSVIEAHTELLARFRRDGTLIMVNSAYAETFGKTPQEMEGRSFFPFIPQEDRDAVRTMLAELNEENPVKTIEHQVQGADGGVRWMEWTNRYIGPDDEGNIVYQAVGRDTTLRVAAETKLRNSEAMLQFAMEMNGIGAYEINCQTGEVIRSKLHKEIFGDDSDDWCLERAILFTHEDDRARVAEEFEAAEKEGRNVHVTARIVRGNDRAIRWVRGTRRVIKAEDGSVLRIIGTIEDVTAEYEAAERVRRTEERMQATIASSIVAIGFGDGYGNITTVNDAFCDLVGYSREEIIEGGVGWDKLTAPEFAELDAEAVRELLETGYASPFQKEYVRKDGSRVPVLVSVAKQPGLDPAEDEHVAFAIDISDIKRTENELRDSEARKSLLMQELQHRVKNTLATVLSIIRFSGRHVDSAAELVASLESRLGSISKTHDVLTQSDWAGSYLGTIIEAELTAYAGSNRFTFSGDDLYLDAKQALSLSLAIHELVTNAAKYGALSGERGFVDLRGERSGKSYRFEWIERDGPKVDAALARERRGFGSLVLDQVVATELGGTSKRRMEPEGVVCVIEFDVE
jgi:two-component system CheB/CheR fusion protein